MVEPPVKFEPLKIHKPVSVPNSSQPPDPNKSPETPPPPVGCPPDYTQLPRNITYSGRWYP